MHNLITFSIVFRNKNGGGDRFNPPPLKTRSLKHPIKTKVNRLENPINSLTKKDKTGHFFKLFFAPNSPFLSPWYKSMQSVKVFPGIHVLSHKYVKWL